MNCGLGLCLASVLAAVGCGQSNGSNTGGAGGSGGSGQGGAANTGGAHSATGGSGVAGGGATLSGFRAAFINAACENLFSCNFGGDAHDMRWLLQTPERCRQFFDGAYGPELQNRIDAVGRGVVRFEPAEAQRCLDVLPTSCMLFEAEEPIDAFYGPCAGVFVGKVAEGAACASDEDCAGSAYCSQDLFANTGACLGTCVTPLAPGSACDSTQRCSANGGDLGACREGRCQLVHLGANVAQGQACGIVAQDTNTISVVGCTGSSWCNVIPNTGVGTCAPPLAVGDLCASENPPCTGGLCVRSGAACVALTRQTSEGAPCREAEYEICDPFSGLTCGTREVCERVAPPSCMPNLPCPAGQYCNEAKQCVPTKTLGAECSSRAECASRLCEQRVSSEPTRCYSGFCSEW